MGLNQPGGKTKVVHGLLDKIGDNSNKKSKQFWLGKGNPIHSSPNNMGKPLEVPFYASMILR